MRRGNKILASYYRRKRLKDGLKIEFTDDLPFKELNPFGDNSIVSLFNEDIAHQNYLRDIQHHRIPRDNTGKFVSYQRCQHDC